MTGRRLRDGVLVGVVWILLASPNVVAQGRLTSHEAGFGIQLSLPSGWEADSQEALSELRERSVAAMRASDLAHLRSFAASNENALLFQARDSRDPRSSANLNVTVSSDLTPRSWAESSSLEIEQMVAYLCGLFVQQAGESGGVAACTQHEVVTLENRGVLVIHQEFQFPGVLDNRRTVAMIPSEGLLFTLTVSVFRDDYDPGVIRAILASIKFPEGL